MTPLPRTELDDKVEASIARHPLPVKRALDLVAIAAIDSTHDDRRAIRHYLREIAKMDVPPEVAHYLKMCAGVVSAVSGHSSGQRLAAHGVKSPGEDEAGEAP